MPSNDILFLEHQAYELRRLSIVATTAAGSGHPTSCLSAADLVAVLFFNTMKFDLRNPQENSNDRFILSKGHAAPLLYAAWCKRGVISEHELLTLRKQNSPLEGHPSPQFLWNEAAAGSLGQGLGIGAGYALAAHLQNSPSQTYVLLGDSELTEGSVWEAAEFSAHNKLTSLTAIVDLNGLGQANTTLLDHHAELCAQRFAAFGWHTIIINGHNITEIVTALQHTPHSTKPTVIIAKTIKGYGIDSIAGKPGYHGKAFTAEELPAALQELATHFPQAAAYKDTKTVTPCMQQPTPREYPQAIIPFEIVNYTDNYSVRKACADALVALGKQNTNLLVLDAEVKNSTYTELFAKQFPEQFVQCYIAEQNMISVATGLTSRGFITFAATFAAFLTRAHDQLRMAAIGKVPLRIIGTHVGVSVGEDGPSQMGLEDIALFRTLPHALILYPCDAVSAHALINLAATYTDGISYVRATREETPNVYDKNKKFVIGSLHVVQQNNNDTLCIIAAGITVHEALKAHKQLAAENIFVRIIDCYSVQPLPTHELLNNIRACNNQALIVEDHYQAGGLGEAIMSALCNNAIHFEHLAVHSIPHSASAQEQRAAHKIDAATIIHKVRTYTIK